MKSKTLKYHGESLHNYFGSKCLKISTASETSSSCSNFENVNVDASDRDIFIDNPVNVKRSLHNARDCPFYKWIPGSSLTVDAFNYGMIKGCQAYLLSHFHSDHYFGLSSRFSGTIYCSAVTMSFVRHTFGDTLKVVALPLNKAYSVCGVDVTALEANHCPGSVMFLCHVKSTKRFILHTGDFRFNMDMLIPPSPLSSFVSDSLVSNASPLHAIYLDTTYCSPQYNFPPQEAVIAGAVKVTRDQLVKHPDAVVVCGMYTIGKERFVLGLASELNLRVWLHKKQHRLVEIAARNGCPICEALMSHVVTNQHKAQLHVLPMGELGMPSLLQYRTSLGPPKEQTPFSLSSKSKQTRSIIAWSPTGWSHKRTRKPEKFLQTTLDSSCSLPDGITLQQCKENIRIYGAAYSEHSSYDELKQFVTLLNPNRVQPTVFGSVAKNSRAEIASWLREAQTTERI